MYYYKLYYDSTLLRDSSELDDYFETEEEAEEEGKNAMESRIEQWKFDDAWNEKDDVRYFDVVVIEEQE